MLRPVSFRRRMATNESNIGSDQMASGAAMATVAGPLSEAPMARDPITRPMSMLPASPRKIVAGGKLKRRKPSKAPANTAATTATADWPNQSAMTVMAAHRMMPMVVASPSMPSSRFSELMAPTSQNSVKGIENQPSAIFWPKSENEW